jgi:V8-like Glu-specific endopeptidase
MQNLERLFGFRVEIVDSLDPVRMEILHERAALIVARSDFDPEQYYLYFHQLNLVLNSGHFARRFSIDQRVSELALGFEINPKQRKTGTIRFFNYLVTPDLPDGVRVSTGEASVHYYLKGGFLNDRLDFRNELITFVSKDIRPEHRKIKVSVAVTPTPAFERHLRKTRGETVTKLDLRFARYTPIKLVQVGQDAPVTRARTKKEDMNRLVGILAREAMEQKNARDFFLELLDPARLPESLRSDSVALIQGDPSKDARRLLRWALVKNLSDEESDSAVLRSILQKLASNDDLQTRYKIPDPDLLLKLAEVQKEGKIGPTIKWMGPLREKQLQSFFKPEPAYQDVGFLMRAIERAACVCRIEIPSNGRRGTGFLIRPNLLLTNYHVLKETPEDDIEANAHEAILRFGAVTGDDGKLLPGQVFRLVSRNPILKASPAEQLDYVLLQVEDDITKTTKVLPAPWDLAPLKDRCGLNILQHPVLHAEDGGGMKIAMSSNGIVHVDSGKGLVQYVTRAAAGSSGSPCFNDQWNVVALHHAELATTFGSIREGVLFSSIYKEIASLIK